MGDLAPHVLTPNSTLWSKRIAKFRVRNLKISAWTMFSSPSDRYNIALFLALSDLFAGGAFGDIFVFKHLFLGLVTPGYQAHGIAKYA